MSIFNVVRPLVTVVVLAISGSALAAPAPRPLPLTKQVVMVRVCEESRPAPGYRDIFARFGARSEQATSPVAAR